MKYAVTILLVIITDNLCKGVNISRVVYPTIYNESAINSNVSRSGIASINRYSCDTSKALPCVEKLTGKQDNYLRGFMFAITCI